MNRSIRIAVPVIALALLSACSTPRYESPSRSVGNVGSGSSVAGVSYGTVRSIEASGIPSDQPQGAGAVVGGVIGAVIGRQMADGNSGRNVGTAVGAVGGALIGNEIEKSARRDQTGVRIGITLDNGALRHFVYRSAGELRVGDRVRIEGEQIYRL
jgi:outer membrane lipoprotein SlyB